MNEPLPITVVIPAYNRAEMVTRAVKSALGQRPRPPAEVLVVDDCSTDGTSEAAEAAGARVVRHERNRGEGAARNSGIAAATHAWIGLLDSDDEWLPHLLATLWPLRDDHVLVGGASLNRGPTEQRYAGSLARRPQTLRSPAAVVYPENLVAASGTIVRRDVVEAAGGYPEGVQRGADMDVWIRALERGTGLVVPQPVVVYHMHPGQVTTDAARMAEAHRSIALAYAARPWWSAAVLERWEGAATYDEARRTWAGGKRVQALARLLGLVRRPTRALGAAGIVVRRLRLRRRTRAIARGGLAP
jgi:glycosyltransferase involved in cell wall biosynthesis